MMEGRIKMKWKKKVQMLSAALCTGLVLSGCGITDVIDNEVRADYQVREGAVILPASTKEVAKSSKVQESLKDFQLALQNEYLELYIGKDYDIAVYEKTTGKLNYSNAAYHEMDSAARDALSDESKKIMFSQVALEYYTGSQTRLTMSSYPDAYSADRNQVTWEVQGDSLIVSYGIGTKLTESVLIEVFTKETFEAYVAQLDQMREEGKTDIFVTRNLTNSYKALTYDQMNESEKKRYSEMYPNLQEKGTVYILRDRLTSKVTNDILQVYTLLGIDEAVKEAEAEKLGEVAQNVIPAFFRVPVRYRLSGGDLLVSVDLRTIEETEGYYLTKVELLKCFGASTKEEEGYMFVPDGSGSIIENNMATNAMDKIVVPFYGEDQAVKLQEGTSVSINNTFPVFGIKADDHAVFAIVENGAAVGGMTAQTQSIYLNYNIAYPYFIYRVVDTFGRQGVSLDFYKNVADVDYTVRYHFLNGKETDYAAMAAYYQQYLVQTGALKRQEGGDNTWGLDVELLGSMKKTINTFGIPIDTDYSVTAFEQAQEIMNLIHNGGISDVDVIYSGAVNGGMEQKALNKVKVQKKLGGLKGYQSLDSSLSSQGDTLYMGLEPMQIAERGNGIRKAEDVTKNLAKKSVVVGQRAVGANENWAQTRWLINPLRYEKVTANFMKQYEKVGSKTIYLQSIGSYLNGNYSAKEGATRQTVQHLTTQMLSQLKDAGYQIKLDVGNDYVLRYADSLINVPITSSHQRVESYSIPFVGMVLKGYLPFTCSSVNQSANADRALLEAVESGAGLSYMLVYENQLNLMETYYENLFSVNYKTQIEKILEDYAKLNAEMGYLQNVRIVGHQHLTEDVNCVTYEDGTKIYVNYGKEAYKVSEGTVEAFSWLVVGR